MDRRCFITGQPIMDKPGRGRKADYASQEARYLQHRLTCLPRLINALQFTPAAAARIRGAFVVLVNSVRVQRPDGTAPEPKPMDKPAREDLQLTTAEYELVTALALYLALYRPEIKKLHLSRCCVTGTLIYSGDRNPRRFVEDGGTARELDLRLQQMRTLLNELVFTPDKGHAIRGQLYSLSCTINAKSRKTETGLERQADRAA